MKQKIIFVFMASLLFACSATTSQPSASTSSESTEPPCWTSPITGICADESVPTLVVKIDDVSDARPQWSLNLADIVIVEPVEGGLTRLFAVYQSTAPTTLGPIRSARVSDIDLAAAFGQPGLAYSGASSKTSPFLWKSTLQLVGAPQGGTGYYRDNERFIPHNLLGEYQDIVERIENPEKALLGDRVGWKFSQTPTLGDEIKWFRAEWPGSKKTFTWDENLSKWKMKVYEEDLMTLIGDNLLEDAVTDTVFVMQTNLMPLPYKTNAISPTPYPKTFGTGTGYVLSKGTIIKATWKRPTINDLPKWYTVAGKEIAVSPGTAWWLVLSERDSLTIKYPKPTKSPTPSESASS
jgi:hypothetical protein